MCIRDSHYLGGLEPWGWFYLGLKDPPKRPELFVALGLLFCVGLVLRVYLTGRGVLPGLPYPSV